MYMKLIEDSRNAQRLDRGMTLIAAGFAHPENRPALINAAFQGGGGGGIGGSGITMENILKMREMQIAEDDRQRQRAALPAIMKQYGLSESTVQYMDSQGQLDELLSKLADPETEVITDGVTGVQRLIDKNTGKTISELSGAKPRETEYVGPEDGPKVLVYKDDRTRVDNGEKVTEIAAKEKPIEYRNLADGRIQVFQNGKPVGEPYGPGEPGPLAEEEAALAAINAERKAADKKPMTMEEYLSGVGKKGVSVNVSPDGVAFPDPPSGQDYERNPDGSVKVFEDGRPRLYSISGSPAAQKEADTAKSEADKAQADISQGVVNTIQMQDVNRAIEMIDVGENDFIGVGGAIPGFLGGSSLFGTQYTFNTLIEKIGTQIGIKELQAMREASTSGASGLGQVTEGEHRMLQSVMGALKPGLPPEELRYNLERIRRGMAIIADGVKDPTTGKWRAPTEGEIATEMGKVQRPSGEGFTRNGYTVRPATPKEDPNARVPTGN